MINLMLVEDNEIVRQALAKYFNQENDITVAAEASDAATAILALQNDPEIDILIADWNMPDMDGLELTTYVTAEFPRVKVIILTMHSKQEYKDKAKAAGAKGFILKDGDFEELVRVVREVAAGKVVGG